MIYELTNLQLTKMLRTLSSFLDKGAEYATTKKFDVEVLLNSRLAPDQLNFIRQVQISCDTAKLGAFRLTGKEAPSHPDTEKTVGDLKERISSTIAYLESLSAKDYAEAKTRHVTQPRWEGQYMTGEDYALSHMVPNFYFHVTMAYAMLRHNGVGLGKVDYLGKLPLQK